MWPECKELCELLHTVRETHCVRWSAQNFMMSVSLATFHVAIPIPEMYFVVSHSHGISTGKMGIPNSQKCRPLPWTHVNFLSCLFFAHTRFYFAINLNFDRNHLSAADVCLSRLTCSILDAVILCSILAPCRPAALRTSMSVLLIVGLKCTLAASHAAPW